MLSWWQKFLKHCNLSTQQERTCSIFPFLKITNIYAYCHHVLHNFLNSNNLSSQKIQTDTQTQTLLLFCLLESQQWHTTAFNSLLLMSISRWEPTEKQDCCGNSIPFQILEQWQCNGLDATLNHNLLDERKYEAMQFSICQKNAWDMRMENFSFCEMT